MTKADPLARATSMVDYCVGRRIGAAGEVPGLREAIAQGLAGRLGSIVERAREQLDHLGIPNSRRIPEAYFADEQETEDELQRTAAGIRAALALGGVIGEPFELELELAESLAPTATWALRSEASRVPRPSTRPIALSWSLPPVPWIDDAEAAFPPAAAAPFAGRGAFVRSETVPTRVGEAPYGDWAQLGLIEVQQTLPSRHPNAPGRVLTIVAGLVALDGSAEPRGAPLSPGSPPSLWAHPHTELVPGLGRAEARSVLEAARGPLAGLVSYDDVPGAPAHNRGAGLARFCLAPPPAVAALLGFRPETPPIRHVLIDDEGPALVCRHWQAFPIHAGDYGPLVPAVRGADLILRADLYDVLEDAVGKDRIGLGVSVAHRERDPEEAADEE